MHSLKPTNSTEQSPSWATNRSSAGQEILCIVRNPKVHYRIHRRPTPVSTLSQNNLVRASPSHFLEILFNIILPSKPRHSKWSLSLRYNTYLSIVKPLVTFIIETLGLQDQNESDSNKKFTFIQCYCGINTTKCFTKVSLRSPQEPLFIVSLHYFISLELYE